MSKISFRVLRAASESMIVMCFVVYFKAGKRNDSTSSKKISKARAWIRDLLSTRNEQVTKENTDKNPPSYQKETKDVAPVDGKGIQSRSAQEPVSVQSA